MLEARAKKCYNLHMKTGEQKQKEFIVHPFPPLFNDGSRVLILGSFPSVKSREQRFFYGHPQNRFWRVTAAVFGEETPTTIEEKREFLLRSRIALWDVIASCEIVGSSDSSIRNAAANDIRPILRAAPIEAVFVNGRTAEKLYKKYTEPLVHLTAVCLPSTSPANAAYSLTALIEAWRVIKRS